MTAVRITSTQPGPIPQRALRGHRPSRPNPRVAAGTEHHAQLARRLTPRDRWLARMLAEHKILTTHHITDLAFPSPRAANLRLHQLYRWRVLDRFQPHLTTGSAPMHYVLDIAGNTALAHEDGLDPRTTGYRHDREIGRAYSLQLAHTVATNSIFTTLVAHSRQPDATGHLAAWWSPTRCATYFGDIVRPDGYGRWHQNNTEIEWFLEYDFGTEPLAKLASKLHGYHQLALTTDLTTPLLIWLPTTRRETTARRALETALTALDHPHLLPIATTATDTSPARRTDATTARWRPLTTSRPGRLPLIDLAEALRVNPPTGTGHRPDPVATPQRAHEPLPPPPTPPPPIRYPLP